MIVIAHQNVGKNANIIIISHFADHIQERQTILVIMKNIFLFISTG